MMSSLKRVQNEFNELLEIDPDNISGSMNEEDNFIWDIVVQGPKDSPYEGGIFFFKVTFPKDYPFKPFNIILQTKIYHPQFIQSKELSGSFKMCCCLTSTGLDSWTPAMTLPKILKETIMPYLSFPDFNNACMNQDFIGKKYDEEFIKRAKEFTQKFAM